MENASLGKPFTTLEIQTRTLIEILNQPRAIDMVLRCSDFLRVKQHLLYMTRVKPWRFSLLRASQLVYFHILLISHILAGTSTQLTKL